MITIIALVIIDRVFIMPYEDYVRYKNTELIDDLEIIKEMDNM